MAARRNKKKPASRAGTAPPATPAGPADQPEDATPRRRFRRPGVPIWRALPRTFQGRLSLAFVMVFALAVGTLSIMTVLVLDDALRQQERTNLEARANAIAAVVRIKAEATAEQNPANVTVVSAGGQLNERVRAAIADSTTLTDYANNVAQADLRLRFGLGSETPPWHRVLRGQRTFDVQRLAHGAAGPGPGSRLGQLYAGLQVRGSGRCHADLVPRSQPLGAVHDPEPAPSPPSSASCSWPRRRRCFWPSWCRPSSPAASRSRCAA